MAKKRFPKTVYVQRYDDRHGCEYLVADGSLCDANDADLGNNVPGERVGVYVLKEVVRIEATHEYNTVPLKSRDCR